MLFAASRGKPISDPPQGGSSKGSGGLRPAAPPGVPPAPRALHGRGCATPRPLGLRPLRALRPAGPCLVDQAGGGWAQGGWATLALSMLRSNPLFNTKRKNLESVGQAKRVRPEAFPCGQGWWEVWGCGQLCCPQVHTDPPLSIGQTKHDRCSPSESSPQALCRKLPNESKSVIFVKNAETQYWRGFQEVFGCFLCLTSCDTYMSHQL